MVEEFEAEKRLAEEGLEKAKEETVLPGWGAWAGEGVKEKKKAAKVVEKPKVGRQPPNRVALVNTNLVENTAEYHRGVVCSRIFESVVPRFFHESE